MSIEMNYKLFIFKFMKWFGIVFAFVSLLFGVLISYDWFVSTPRNYPDFSIYLSITFMFAGVALWKLAGLLIKILGTKNSL